MPVGVIGSAGMSPRGPISIKTLVLWFLSYARSEVGGRRDEALEELEEAAPAGEDEAELLLVRQIGRL